VHHTYFVITHKKLRKEVKAVNNFTLFTENIENHSFEDTTNSCLNNFQV